MNTAPSHHGKVKYFLIARFSWSPWSASEEPAEVGVYPLRGWRARLTDARAESLRRYTERGVEFARQVLERGERREF